MPVGGVGILYRVPIYIHFFFILSIFWSFKGPSVLKETFAKKQKQKKNKQKKKTKKNKQTKKKHANDTLQMLLQNISATFIFL